MTQSVPNSHEESVKLEQQTRCQIQPRETQIA